MPADRTSEASRRRRTSETPQQRRQRLQEIRAQTAYRPITPETPPQIRRERATRRRMQDALYAYPRWTEHPGVTLSRLRREHGLTQGELSDLSGVPRRRIAECERGIGRLHPLDALLMESVLEVSADFLMMLEVRFTLDCLRNYHHSKVA